MNKAQPASNHDRAYHHGDLRRSLIDAAVAMLNESQDWNFSAREVARRAGVSHNAPYNHFADKNDLLAAVAAAGFDTLRERMVAAIEGIEDARKALLKVAVVYAKFGVENPAHYRLMFGSALGPTQGDRPELTTAAGLKSKAVLEEIIHRGARQGVLAVSPEKKDELNIAVLSAWSVVHGLTMLAIDGFAAVPRLTTERLAEKIAQTVTNGLIHR
jgi:AcrR family transcriptional regulator